MGERYVSSFYARQEHRVGAQIWRTSGATGATTTMYHRCMLIRYQIQRANQEDVTLDIDHPPSSPDPPVQNPTLSSSPPYNTHIPTPTHAPKLASQAWASPAFLKRSHFSASTYDPFAETDFPDNDRRKKTKFGRSSSEWKYSERTPSPEKDADTATFDMPSPSDREAPEKTIVSTGILSAQPIVRETSNDQTVREVTAEEATNGATLGQPSSPTASSTEPPEGTAEDSLPKESSPAVQHISSASSQPSSSSSEASGLEQHEVMQDAVDYQPDGSDAGIFSGHASEFGLDGSAFSRAEQTLDATEDTAEYVEGFEIKRSAEVDLTNVHDMEPLMPEGVGPSDPGYTAEDHPSTIKESMHEFMIFEGHDSDHAPNLLVEHAAQEAHRLSPFKYPEPLESEQAWGEIVTDDPAASEKGSPSLTADKASPEASNQTSLGEALDVKATQLEIASDEEVESEDINESGIYEESEEEDSEGEEVEYEIGSDDEYSQDEESSLEEEPQDGQIADEDPQRDKASLREPLESKKSAVEIIDLESSDEDEQSARSTSPEPVAPETVMAQPDQIDSGPLQEDLAAMQQTEKWSSGDQDAPQNKSPSPALAADTKEVTLQPAKTDQESLSTEPTPSSQPSKPAPSPPPEELPSTVRDTYDDKSSKSQLMTPSDTQQSSLVSQLSFPSMQTLPGGDTLPTSRLTQGTSAGIVPPELFSLPASQEQLELQPLATEEETETIDTKPSTPQRAPNLIEKLKAMRKLSSQSSRRSSDISATSPWFAPKRSSQIVPDSEAESEVESLSGNDRSIMQDVTSASQTQDKQKLSANAVKSSPARPTTAASMVSSPGYFSPSQPPPPGFRTNLSYFVPLATLLAHFTTTVDVLAIAVSSTPVTRATSGPKDYNQTIYLTDPSSSTLKPPIRSAQIFRSYNKCFPIMDTGDAVMLRDFRVQSFQRQMTLLSTQSSSWAVFRKGQGVQVRGPPIEFGAEERLFARGMWRWWDGLKEEERVALEDAVPKEEPKKAITKDNKTNGTTNTAKKAQNVDEPKPKIKKEALEGLGIELQGSQSKARKAYMRERSLGLDGTSDSDKIMESTEPPRRVLRPRGAKGLPEKSESLTKATESRYGSVFTGGLGEPESD